MLNTKIIKPSPLLQPYVRSFFMMQGENIDTKYIHPGGGYGMVFNLGDPFSIDDVKPSQAVFLDGSNTVSRKFEFKGKVKALSVRFYAGIAYSIFRIPLHELNNVIEMPFSMNELAEQLAEASSERTQLALIEQWLLKRIETYHSQADIIPLSLQNIRSKQFATEQFTIKQFADDLFIGQRQLERLYKTHVGMTPLKYARLLRIDHARTMLNTQTSIARLGAKLGYYDQAHFTRDFQSIVGITPGRYVQYSQVRECPNDLSVENCTINF